MKFFISLFIILPILPILPIMLLGVTYAQMSVTLKNCYNKTLHVKLGNNAQLLPEFNNNFPIPKEQAKKSIFKVPTGNLKTGNEVYIIATPSGESNVEVFFGIEYNGKGLNVDGYIDTNLAYSWHSGEKATVTFCDPKQYKNGACPPC